MPLTDIVVCAILIILAVKGFHQGFLRSLIGPICLLLSIAASYIILFTWHDIPTALLFSLLGPFILPWAMNGLIQLWRGDAPQDLEIFSRFTGAAISLAWGGTFLIMTLLLATLIPINGTSFSFIREDMNRSTTYHLLAKALAHYFPLPQQAAECLGNLCSMNNDNKQALANDQDVKDLMEDPRLQRIANDASLREAIQKKDISALMSNPAIVDLTRDPSFVVKMLKLYPKIQRYTQPQQTTENSQ